MAVVLRQKIGSQNTHYVHGLSGIQSQVANSVWHDAVSDGLGSVRGWLDGAGDFVDTMSYNPYGVPDGAVDGFGFTGEMTDANGLVHLRARYYDPNVGVFASLDPFEGIDDFPMSLNGYSYVEGNPINWVDLSGLNHRLARLLNDGQCFNILQDTDADDSITRIIPFRLPRGSSTLPEWIRNLTERVCDQLCNPDHQDNVFGGLTTQCRNQTDQICNFLCADSPRDPNLPGDYDHYGLFLRWMQYYIDLNNTRNTHEHAYKEVQKYLAGYMDENFFNSDCGGFRSAESVRELARVAQEWTKKRLETPARISIRPDRPIIPWISVIPRTAVLTQIRVIPWPSQIPVTRLAPVGRIAIGARVIGFGIGQSFSTFDNNGSLFRGGSGGPIRLVQ